MSEEQRLTLSTLEQHLAALQEIEAEISLEQEAEFQLALSDALLKATEKRDRVAHVVLELMRQASVASDMADSYEPIVSRLHAREKRFRAAADRLSWYVLAVMQTLPKPPKGPRKLEGTICTLKANGVPPSVEVLDESQVPLEWKRVTVKMSATEWIWWRSLAKSKASVPEWERMLVAIKESYEVDRTALLEALKKPCATCSYLPVDTPERLECPQCHGIGKQQIPGVRLGTDKLRLAIE